MKIRVVPGPAKTAGTLIWSRRRAPCVLGRGGVTKNKREGDGATPVGAWPLRRLFYRADRRARPETALPVTPIRPHMGWCDDPASPAYNRLLRLPCPWGHERLWRADRLYDLVVELGYNDAPPVPGAGSAIFLHLMAEDGRPTDGCVALAEPDLSDLLAVATAGDSLVIGK